MSGASCSGLRQNSEEIGLNPCPSGGKKKKKKRTGENIRITFKFQRVLCWKSQGSEVKDTGQLHWARTGPASPKS